MRIVTTVCFLFFTAVAATLAGVPDWLVPEAGNANRSNPKLTKGWNGVLLLTYTIEGSDGVAEIRVAASNNDGLEWVEVGSPGNVSLTSMGLQRQPTTVGTKEGAMHTAWESFNPISSRVGVYHTFSTDGGTTWASPKVAYEDPFGGNQTFASIAAGPDGRVFITYLSRDLLTDNNRVMLVSTTDNGTTWTGPVRVDRFTEGGACDCCVQNVAVSSEGQVAVSFRSNINNRRDIWVSRSDDTAETFSSPILIQDQVWTIFGCPSSGPTLEYDAQGDLHFSWRDERDAAQKSIVYYARLNNGETIVSQNVKLSDFAKVGEYSDVSVDPSGMLVQVIYETSDGLFVSQSNDGGASFRSTNIVDADMPQGASAHAVWTPTQGHVSTWQSMRGETFDVRLRNEITSSVQSLIGSSARVWTSNGSLAIEQPTAGAIVIRFIDMQGRQLGTTTTGASNNIQRVELPNVNGPIGTLISTQAGQPVWSGVVFR